MTREPLITTSFIVAAAAAVLGLLTAFGADLSDGQQKAVMGVIIVLAPVAVAVLARGKVSPTTIVAARRDGKDVRTGR